MAQVQFRGFPGQTIKFLQELSLNNDREWFAEHREEFDEFMIEPARHFVVAMGQKLQTLVPQVHAIPAIDKSIFRVHRDTRFSKDKSPYKTHLGIFFWEGESKKMECPGFYFHLEADKLMIGGGMHAMTPAQLTLYRETVADDKQGPKLEKILKEGHKHFKGFKGDYTEPYKRVPRGFAADHPRAELLKRKGVTLGETTAIPKSLHTPALIDYVFKRFEKMLPMHRWLLAMVNRNGYFTSGERLKSR